MAALLPSGVGIAPSDQIYPLEDGWGEIGSVRIYTRSVGVGTLPLAALTETEGCYLDVTSGTPMIHERYGVPPSGATTARIAGIRLAPPFRGRGLGRRALRSCLELMAEKPYVFALDVVPTRPSESDRSVAEARELVEQFWRSVGFHHCEKTETVWTALGDDVRSLLAPVSPL